MKLHNVKTWPEPFADLEAGRKTAEFRIDDRNYQVGDLIVHHEYEPKTECYTGDKISTVIRHKLKGGYGIPDGYCMMSVVLCSPIMAMSIEDLIDRMPDNYSIKRIGANYCIADPDGKEILGTGWFEPLGALEQFFKGNPTKPFPVSLEAA